MKYFFRILLYIYSLQVIYKLNILGNKLDVNLENLNYNLHTLDDNILHYHFLEKRNVPSDFATANESASVEMDKNIVQIPLIRTDQNDTEVNTEVNTEPSSSVYDTDSEDDHEPAYNITKMDHHKYYRSYYKSGVDDVNQYWVNMDTLPEEKKVAHASLSNAYRRALTVSLKFDFPFYGHTLHNVTIATGGFLFTGVYLHKWLAATQYIAPLMANFDTSSSEDSIVVYADNGW